MLDWIKNQLDFGFQHHKGPQLRARTRSFWRENLDRLNCRLAIVWISKFVGLKSSLKSISNLTVAYASNELTRNREQNSVLHVTRDDRNN